MVCGGVREGCGRARAGVLGRGGLLILVERTITAPDLFLALHSGGDSGAPDVEGAPPSPEHLPEIEQKLCRPTQAGLLLDLLERWEMSGRVVKSFIHVLSYVFVERRAQQPQDDAEKNAAHHPHDRPSAPRPGPSHHRHLLDAATLPDVHVPSSIRRCHGVAVGGDKIDWNKKTLSIRAMI